MIATVALAVAIAVQAPAMSAPKITMMGLNSVTCGTYLTHRHDRTLPLWYDDVQWAVGFLSGVSWEWSAESRHDILAGLDGNAVAAWLDNYCAAHPLDDLATAAGQLALKLERER